MPEFLIFIYIIAFPVTVLCVHTFFVNSCLAALLLIFSLPATLNLYNVVSQHLFKTVNCPAINVASVQCSVTLFQWPRIAELCLKKS